MALHPELVQVLRFLNKHKELRLRLAAPVDKTVVYSGGMTTTSIGATEGLHRAWRMLAQAKANEPGRFDYITLEERLRQFHAVDLGESLFEHANRVSASLKQRGLEDQSMILWRALSGIYVQGARGRVRALILPTGSIASSVFSLTEVRVLMRPDVLHQIDMNPELLRNFCMSVRAGAQPAPIVVM